MDDFSTFLSLLLSPAEQRVKIAANERWREYNEDQRNEHENYAEEARDGKTCMQLLSVPFKGSQVHLPSN